MAEEVHHLEVVVEPVEEGTSEAPTDHLPEFGNKQTLDQPQS